ncbi:MAG: thioredoxin family protein [Flavobacteriales bacterium]|nr:thioredoxin family protein [Flavobacteriales bacterium]
MGRQIQLLKAAFIALTMFFFIAPVQAQMVPPAKWSYQVVTKNPKSCETIEVVFKAEIPESFHVYSNDYNCPNGGPLPSVFTFTPHASFKLVGGAKPVGAKKVYDDIFECDITEFHHKAEFRQKIELKNTSPVIKGILEYQMCTEQGMCVLHEYEFNIKIDGVTNGCGSSDPVQVIEPTIDVQPDAPESTSATADSDTGNLTAVNSELLEQLLDCCKGGSDEADGGSPYVSKEDVNYASYVKAGENDTTSCEVKTFDGESKEESESFLGFFLIAFLSGLLALLTPCVFPMIPMTVSFFMKEGDRGKAIRTGIIYGLSIVGIYVVIGTVVAVVAGPAAANWLSTHWIPNTFFFLVFVIFAASFLGAFEITLPSWMVNKVDKQSDKGGLVGVFFMAFTIVLVSFSCTGPIVGSILVESAGGAFVKPLIGMLGFSLAFAIPFALFAIFPSMLNNLPQSGGWLNSVKVVLGFIELAFGLKFLSVADQTYHWGILDREIYIGLWIVIFALMGFYLLGKLKFSHDSDLPYISVPRLFMAILTFTFVVYLGAGLWGAPLKQLAGYLPPMHTHDFNLLGTDEENPGHGGITPMYRDELHLPHGLRGYFDYDQGMEVARQLGKPVMLDFTGHGCVNCREMEARVWSEPRILNKIHNDYVLISLYVDDKTIKLPESEWYTSRYSGNTVKTLAKKNADIQACFFNSNSQPQYALLDNKGELLQPVRAYDLNRETYLAFLENGLQEFSKRVLEAKASE